MRYQSLIIGMLFLLLPVQSFAAEKLVLAIDLIRHGDRTPVSKLKKTNYVWKEGLGQLTPIGMQQEYELGQLLRKRYVDQTHLLPEKYETGTMYVRSTDYDRTLMSAECLLLGLYPKGPGPHGYQPIPIHSAPTDADAIIISRIDPVTLKKSLQENVYSTAAWKQKETELRPHFKHWSEATGTTIHALTDLNMGDALRIHRLYKAPMPAGLTKEDIDLIVATCDWMFVQEMKARPVAALYSQKVMNHILETLEKNARGGPHLKYALLSAHDSTVASVLSLLGAPATAVPHYASDVNFSLYENSNRKYAVRVTYNGTPVNIPACGGTECTLAQFKSAAEGGASVDG